MRWLKMTYGYVVGIIMCIALFDGTQAEGYIAGLASAILILIYTDKKER